MEGQVLNNGSCQGLYLLGKQKHLQEPLIKLEVGPQEQLMEFLVDTGAERTCVTEKPQGCFIAKETLNIYGAKGETFAVPLNKDLAISGNGCTQRSDVLFLPQAGTNLLGRNFQIRLKIRVVPQEGQMKTKLFVLCLADENDIDPEVWAKPKN